MKRKQAAKPKKRWLTLRKAFFISLIAHMLLLGGVGCPGCGGGNGKDGKGKGDGTQSKDEKKDEKKKEAEKSDEERIKEKPVEIKVTHVHMEKGAAQLRAEAWARHLDECKNFFGGVGVMWDPNSGAINTVYANYPADEAGIKPGDVITDDHYSLRGEIGTSVTIHILRDGTPMTFETHRGKICLEDAIKANKP